MDTADQIIREDIRDLTRIIETEKVASLIVHLPDRIGSPLSVNALREDLEVSFTAVKNAISALQLTCVIFLVPPYSRSISYPRYNFSFFSHPVKSCLPFMYHKSVPAPRLGERRERSDDL